MDNALNSGDTAWVLVSAALVLLMTPGLAFFYGGMVRAKSVLNMMMMASARWASSASSGSCGATRWPSATTSAAGSSATPSSSSASSGLITDVRRRSRRPRPAASRRRLRRLPGRLRDHHGGAHQRRDRRPRQVRHLARLRRHLGHPRLLPASPTGSSPSTASRPRRAAGSPHRGLSRQLAPSTSPVAPRPHQRRCRGPRARARARQAGRLRQGADAPAQPAPRHARRRHCCGSAGSASTPARRSAPTARPASPGSTPSRATCAAMLGWLAHGEDPRRARHLARRRVRRRRRPGRHHPGLRRALDPGRRARRRCRRRRRSAPSPSA